MERQLPPGFYVIPYLYVFQHVDSIHTVHPSMHLKKYNGGGNGAHMCSWRHNTCIHFNGLLPVSTFPLQDKILT